METKNEHGHELLTIAKTAMELRLSSPTVRRLIGEGVIPVVQLAPAHAVRIKRADLDKLLEAEPRSAV